LSRGRKRAAWAAWRAERRGQPSDEYGKLEEMLRDVRHKLDRAIAQSLRGKTGVREAREAMKLIAARVEPPAIERVEQDTSELR
jgi:hypothetical protein